MTSFYVSPSRLKHRVKGVQPPSQANPGGRLTRLESAHLVVAIILGIFGIYAAVRPFLASEAILTITQPREMQATPRHLTASGELRAPGLAVVVFVQSLKTGAFYPQGAGAVDGDRWEAALVVGEETHEVGERWRIVAFAVDPDVAAFIDPEDPAEGARSASVTICRKQ